jgi:hypothetical protein
MTPPTDADVRAAREWILGFILAVKETSSGATEDRDRYVVALLSEVLRRDDALVAKAIAHGRSTGAIK